MSSNTIRRGFAPQTQTTRTDSPTQQNTVAPKPQKNGMQADGHYRSTFNANREVNKNYNKTFSRGDTSDLFTPSSKPSKMGGLIGGLLPNVSREGSWSRSVVGKEYSGSFNKLGGLAQGQGRITLGEAYVKANGKIGIEGGALKATGSAQASATLLAAEGSVRFGKGDYTLDAKGEAYVGARANASGELTIDPAKGIYAAKIGGEAFAGARIGGEANLNLGQFGGAGVRAEAWAGIGASFKAEAGFKDGRFKARLDIGAALGVGFKLGFNIDINVKGIKDAVVKAVKAPVEAVKNVVNNIGEGIKDIGKGIGNAIKKLKFW
jgi:hypothetical protein